MLHLLLHRSLSKLTFHRWYEWFSFSILVYWYYLKKVFQLFILIECLREKKKNKKNAIVKYIVANFSDVCCAKSPNQRPAINSINLVPSRASRFPPLLQWHGHPHSQTHVAWASPSHITLAILVRDGVTGDADITMVFEVGMPKTRGCSYHCDTIILENEKTLGTRLH